MRIIKTTTLEKIAENIKKVQFSGIYGPEEKPPKEKKIVDAWGRVKIITLKN